MRLLACIFLLSVSVHISLAQVDPTKQALVYQMPGMDKVSIQKGLVYKTVQDTLLKFDIYYPPNFDKKSPLPLVIFNNGVGINQLPDWRVYQDWAKLVAMHGMIAINHQSRQNHTLKDTEDLVDYLRKQASSLHIDPERIGLWACSANVGTALPLSMQAQRRHIRALVMYYGAGWKPEDNVVKRQDLEILLVRAGLDFYDLNKNIESFMKSALETDAHLTFVNYPEGQHAFDALDDTQRSREIIKQTLDFLKQKLSKGYPQNESFVLTNRMLWHMIMDEKKTEEALAELKKAIAKYRGMPNHSPWYNHIIDERNLNQMGYQLLKDNRTDDAIKVFTANQEAFPDSPNVYDALADAYEKSGNTTKAVSQAKLALEKLEKATQLHQQLRQSIKESAQSKINRLDGK